MVRPSLTRRVWTPMAGMDRYTGRVTLVTPIGRGGATTAPAGAAARVRDRPRGGPLLALQQHQAARSAADDEQATAEQGGRHRPAGQPAEGPALPGVA